MIKNKDSLKAKVADLSKRTVKKSKISSQRFLI